MNSPGESYPVTQPLEPDPLPRHQASCLTAQASSAGLRADDQVHLLRPGPDRRWPPASAATSAAPPALNGCVRVRVRARARARVAVLTAMPACHSRKDNVTSCHRPPNAVSQWVLTCTEAHTRPGGGVGVESQPCRRLCADGYAGTMHAGYPVLLLHTCTRGHCKGGNLFSLVNDEHA